MNQGQYIVYRVSPFFFLQVRNQEFLCPRFTFGYLFSIHLRPPYTTNQFRNPVIPHQQLRFSLREWSTGVVWNPLLLPRQLEGHSLPAVSALYPDTTRIGGTEEVRAIVEKASTMLPKDKLPWPRFWPEDVNHRLPTQPQPDESQT